MREGDDLQATADALKGMNDAQWDELIASIDRMRGQSRHLGQLARLGSAFVQTMVVDVHDALDIQKARKRVAQQNGYET